MNKIASPKEKLTPEQKNFDSIKIKNYLPKQKPLSVKTAFTEPETPKSSPLVISLLQTNPAEQKKSFRFLKFFLLGCFCILLFLVGLVVYRTANISDKIFVGKKLSFFNKIKEVIRGVAGNEVLVGENLGKINILLLGIGGQEHEGPYLSDTIIFAQIRPDTQEVSLTSIPRDLLAEMPKNSGYKKINTAFAEGFSRNKSYKEAGEWAISSVEKITGQIIPYFAVVDFRGFEDGINKLGGITINVEKDFTDFQFPGKNYDYLPPVTFQKGSITMDGKTALMFARSRHGNNGEGSDFARSLRQQKVIEAFKQKILNLNLITDAGSINGLVNTFANHFHTNLTPGEIFRLFKISHSKNINKFLSSSLDEQTGLICPKILEENGAWVLVTCKNKTLGHIHDFFKNAFLIGKLKTENSVIWLATSTDNQKAYQSADQKLKNIGLTVWEVGFDNSELPENIIYQVNPKPATLEFIKNTIGATEVTLPPPGIKIDAAKVDLIIILGKQ